MLNENINKTELMKIEKINNQNYTLKSGGFLGFLAKNIQKLVI